MENNKYLEKLASVDSALRSVIGYGDRLIGHTAGKYRVLHSNLANAHHMGVSGISQHSIDKAKELMDNHAVASKLTRIKTGLTAGTLGLGGFLAARKHQSNKDNEILQSIYQDQQNLQ